MFSYYINWCIIFLIIDKSFALNEPNRQNSRQYSDANHQDVNHATGEHKSSYLNRQKPNNVDREFNYPNGRTAYNAAGQHNNPNRQNANTAAGRYNYENQQKANTPGRSRNYPKRQVVGKIAREYNFPYRQNPNKASAIKLQNADSDILKKTDLEKFVFALDKLLKFYVKAPNDIDVNIVFGFFLLKVNLYSALDNKIGPDGNVTGLPVALSDKLRNITRMNEGIIRYFRAMLAQMDSPARQQKQLKKLSSLFSNATQWASLLKTFDNKEVVDTPEISYSDIVYRFSSWPEYKTLIGNVQRIMPSFELTEKCLLILAENKVNKGNSTWPICNLPTECHVGISTGNDVGYAMTNRLSPFQPYHHLDYLDILNE